MSDTARPTMTVDEVADLLGISRWSVYDAASRGRLPCRRLGRRVIFSRQAIHDWLNAQSLPGRTAG